MIDRHCTGCNTTKLINEFVKDKYDKTGYTYRCKACRRKQCYAWAKANPDKVKAANLKNREKRKKFYDSEAGRRSSQRSWLKVTYGLSIEDYDLMVLNQDSKCAVCGSADSKDRWKRLAVDHCHSTGKIRDLLCYKCNAGLGLFNDNKEILLKAINYLTKHESTTSSRLL